MITKGQVSRRKFLSLSLLTPLVKADLSKLNDFDAMDGMPKEEFSGAPDWPSPKFSYKGYEVHWTGWKYCQESRNIEGQWLAYPPWDRSHDDFLVNYRYLSLNLPGGVWGIYKVGDKFDLSCDPKIRELTKTKSGRLKLLKSGRKRLMEIMDGES